MNDVNAYVGICVNAVGIYGDVAHAGALHPLVPHVINYSISRVITAWLWKDLSSAAAQALPSNTRRQGE